ncbi:MAG: hypothetical protein LBF97_00890 [Elusimicrobiota bacterium]|jgi:hypothetical protein|nr:hypothetical protein [Elusimicrobiota bacterium]
MTIKNEIKRQSGILNEIDLSDVDEDFDVEEYKKSLEDINSNDDAKNLFKKDIKKLKKNKKKINISKEEKKYPINFKTLIEENLSIEGAYTQLQELLKAQQELQSFSKQNPAIGANQNYQRILQQLSLQGQGLNKSLQTLIAQKKQADLQKAKAQQQNGQVTPIGQQATATPQANTTPNPNVPVAANGNVSGVPKKTV